MQKRLQVFISSTFEDMRPEREAAIKAILQAKHVPAGMEMFAAGSESQWEVIKQWIDSCDVFLLILGGRYGSIEPKSDKSYIELEYDYAEQQGKELFAVVMTDEHTERKVKAVGSSVIETANPSKLRVFRDRVKTKMSGRCDDLKDITVEIFKAMMEIVQKDAVQGWVPGGEYRRLQIELEAAKQRAVSTGAAAGEKSRAEKHSSFEAFRKILAASKVSDEIGGNLLEVLRTKQTRLMYGVNLTDVQLYSEACPLLEIFSLVARRKAGNHWVYHLNDAGKQLVAALMSHDAGVELD